MKQRKVILPIVLRVGQAALTGMICGSLVVPPAFAAEGVSGGTIPAERHVAPLTQQEKVLHALNRFTFGPRPGDAAAVEKMGLDKWFQMQLHPERIGDAAFELQMEQYPSMRLSEMELMRRFPSGPMIRRMSKGDVPLPGDPVEHAVYADAEAAYQAKQKKDADENAAADAAAKVAVAKPTHDDGAVMGGAPGSVSGGKVASGTLMSDGTVAGTPGGVVGGPTHDESCADGGSLACGFPKAPGSMADGEMMGGAAGGAVVGKGGKARLKSVVDPMEDADVAAVLGLGPDERMERLVGMEPKEMLGFRVALRPKDRLALIAGLSPTQVETAAALLGGPERVVAEEAMESRLMRDVDSQRQLQAVMTDFWLNHFNVYLRKNENEPYMLPEYEQRVILPHALGKFEDLLVATAMSPAMLTYLDNWESIGPNSLAAGRVAKVQQARPNGKIAQKLPKGINENYGRGSEAGG